MVRRIVAGVLSAVAAFGAHAVDPTASALFEQLRPLVYQLRIIDVASGDKSAIGSGFLVSDQGHVATNYHVIQPLVDEAAKHRLELVDDRESVISAKLLSVDPINDLAIVQIEDHEAGYFQLVDRTLGNGERVYSMGNPRDLGMTIIEGNYNGLVKTSRFKRFLFTGSLNPGMSGGPAFDERGDLVGVNVSTGGEQLSFLVPARFLKALMRKTLHDGVTGDFKVDVTAQLLAEQDQFYRQRIDDKWVMQAFGELTLPRGLSPAMKCWGHNVEGKDKPYSGFHQHCRSEEYLYLRDDFYTGNFSYDFEWMTSIDLNPVQFYAAVQSRFVHTSVSNTHDEEHVTPFACNTGVVSLDEVPWKSSVCVRQYKDHAGLHDALLTLASLHSNDRAAVVRMSATGISRAHALNLFTKLMNSIAWDR